MTTPKAKAALCAIVCALASTIGAQQYDSLLSARLSDYMRSYHVSGYRPLNPFGVSRVATNDSLRTVSVGVNETFASQPMSDAVVSKAEADIKSLLPDELKGYSLSLSWNGIPLRTLVPAPYSSHPDASRRFQRIDYAGAQWTKNRSWPIAPRKALLGRHICVWASHGKYFDNSQNAWLWQRPNLYCSTEDLLTQTFVVPFLMPMLERAGAVVFSPRERSWQRNEAIVDNDAPTADGKYSESANSRMWETSLMPGWAKVRDVYGDRQNPFRDGTARTVATSKEPSARAVWTPNIPADGDYAVYVSYQTFPTSISDAHYTIRHKGIETRVDVNQQMGGGTWVYLGTYSFDKGCNESRGAVVLTNESRERGTIVADAVRFGGGMGNIRRERLTADSTALILSGTTSQLPRYLEGARYSAQWAGMTYSVYSSKNGVNDYGDDINARSYMLNYLSGGSVYLPDSDGLKVPFELSLAVHTDAGFRRDHGPYGTLAICTTQGNDSRKDFINGMSRMASYDFASLLRDGVANDIRRIYGLPWPKRELYNRNYSETRNPEVPSAIIESLSHQNFTDMRLAHDPNFKFQLARSIYKNLLRYVHFAHGDTDYVVQPLPVRQFSVNVSSKGVATLRWAAAEDSINPTAKPAGYILYTAKDNNDFDNGTLIAGKTSTQVRLEPNIDYRFRVSAYNEGGESFPSETLAAHSASNRNARRVLVVNAFTRLSGPAFTNSADSLGFRLDIDPGVSYVFTPEYCGRQKCFNRNAEGRVSANGLGHSGDELAGQPVGGNTFNYPALYLPALKGHTVASASREAVEDGEISLSQYDMVVIIFGLQRNTSANLLPYSTYSPQLRNALQEYARRGGRMLLSGSHIGSDLGDADSRDFALNVLHYSPNGTELLAESDTVAMEQTHFQINRAYSESHYAVIAPDVLMPANGAKSLMQYADGQTAATAYSGKSRVACVGFPIESIACETDRNAVISKIANFLLEK